ncbi:MAG: GAF domain-containing protein [Bacteroidia bacterium]|nr:GAF domain-containing protein [Bacteroidia bacterium]
MESINLLQELDSISKIHTLTRDDIDSMMIEFAHRITIAMKIERMSVWLFNEGKTAVVSMGEYELPQKRFIKGRELFKKKFPAYFEAIAENKIIVIENVYKSNVTEELTEEYNRPQDIISLMDIPLRICGELVGVMCFEKTGSTERIFTHSDQAFALSVSNVFASNLEARQRRALQVRLDQELKEKALLLKEIHHRVKNNLSIISSLINLQMQHVKDDYHRSLFAEHREKINSIALIHELVYKSKDFSEINLKTYIEEISLNLAGVYHSSTKTIELESKVENVIVDINYALPLGLIINEVMTNSFKHAFKDTEKGKITIELSKEKRLVKLKIGDNGSGLNSTIRKEESLGMEILKGLIEQIEGRYSFSNDRGTVFTMEFYL